MVMAGQSCGKGSEEDWHGYKRCGIKWSLILSAIACAAILLSSDLTFSALYSNDTSSLEIASVIMIFVAVVSFPEAHAILSAGILRGSGKAAQVAGYSYLSITFPAPAHDRLLPLCPGSWPHRLLVCTPPRSDHPCSLRDRPALPP